MLHLLVGAAGLVLFVLQGQYMEMIAVGNMPDGPRMMHRSAHIYLMLASALNVFVGYYLPAAGKQSVSSWLFSILLATTPCLFVYGFMFESAGNTLNRPVISTALYILFLASAVLLVSAYFNDKKNPDKAD